MTKAVITYNANTTSEENYPHDQDNVRYSVMIVQVQGLGLQSTLYIMWPGLVAASAALFLVARY